MFPFLCQYHAVLITMALQYSLYYVAWFLQLRSSFSGSLLLWGAFCGSLCICVYLRFYLFIYFLEGKGGRKRRRETSVCGCLSHAPYWGPGQQLRHVPWLGLEPSTSCLAGLHSILHSIYQPSLHMYFWNIPYGSMKYVIGNLIGIALNLQIALGNMGILMMLVLPIHECGMYFHLCVSFSMSSFIVIIFWVRIFYILG